MLIPKSFCRFGLISLGFLSALLVIFGVTALRIYAYGNARYLQKADAAIVLGAAVWGEKPSPVFRERINHAIELYSEKSVPLLIFTGGVGNNDKLAEATVAQNYAIRRGVNRSDILIETQSRTTQQNLQNAYQLVRQTPLKKFVIVSDPLHMKRAVLMAQDLGMDAYPSPTPTTRYRSFNSQLSFLMRETYFYWIYMVFKI